MKFILPLLFLGLSSLAAAAPAKADPVLIEVFANHNCAACPKAHENMAEIEKARGEDVIILTWVVDYWDYLGEPDPMAMKEAVERQNAYADHFSLRGPYTPQTVFDGADQCAGNKMSKVERIIEAREKAPASPIAFERSEAGAWRLTGGAADTAISLIEVAHMADTDMVNPVISMQSVATSADGSFTADCETQCVLIAQEAGQGAVHTAAWVN